MNYYVASRAWGTAWSVKEFSSKNAKAEAEREAELLVKRKYEQVLVFTPCAYGVHESILVKVES